MTNILRDVREDAERGRVYLPAEDLRRFGVNAGALCSGAPSDAFKRLMRFEADRAWGFYRESQPLVGLVHKRSRPALRALIGIYSRLLRRIEEGGFDVTRRVSLSVREKGWIVVKAWMGGER